MAKKKYKSPEFEVKMFPEGAGTAPDAAQVVDAAQTAQQAGVPLGDLFKQLGGWVKANPWAAAGTGLNAAGNVAGLMDNDKLLGQAAGAALGYFAPGILGKVLGKNIIASPLMQANLAMGGGNLGALFDNLRAKQEEEQAMLAQQQYYGG